VDIDMYEPFLKARGIRESIRTPSFHNASIKSTI